MAAALKGRVALVTGATRGLGAAVAKGLGAAGAHVILVGRTVGGLEETDDTIRSVGGSATLVPLDLIEFDKIDELGRAIFERWKRLDILIGNAAILGRIGPMGHLEPAKFDAVMAVNVTANWRLIRSLDPLLRAAPAGRALFITCTVGREPTAYWSAYAASKAALEMMIATWNAELRLTPLRAEVVDPGPIATRLRREAFPGEDTSTIQTPETAAARLVERLCFD